MGLFVAENGQYHGFVNLTCVSALNQRLMLNAVG